MDSFLKKTVFIYDLSHIVFIVSYFLLALIPLRISPIFYLGFVLLYTIAFFLYKDYSESKFKPFTMFRTGITVFALSIPHYLSLMIEESLKFNIPTLVDLMFGIILVMLAIYLLFNENEEKVKTIDQISIKNIISSDDNKKKDDFDIVLCKNLQTGKDVVLEANSRYLHNLIIGPTGCGKTSQILIPMIVQDIQKGHSVIVIEPKGDLAEKVYAMGKKYGNEVIYFNPTAPDCPRFNPLVGKEDQVIETLTTIFVMLSPDSATYFKDISDNLIRKSVMTLKRIEEAYRDPVTKISSRPATLVGLSDILHNPNNAGRDIMNDLLSVPCLTPAEEKENKDIVDWFLTEYYADKSKIYENASGIRQQVSKFILNKHLRRVLNPIDGVNDIDFDDILLNGKSIAISTAQGDLRELGSYLGYFIIFSLQSAVFRRPGNEFTRNPTFFYADECQKYLVPGMQDLFQQARSYRFAMTLATQSRAQIKMEAGKYGEAFLETVTANSRNVIAFPGISLDDAKYFSLTFGEEERIKERHGETKQKFSLAYGFKDMNYPTQSVSKEQVTEVKYSEANIIFKEFSEITYKIIINNTVQLAQDGKAAWIPKELNAELDAIVKVYNDEQNLKRQIEEEQEAEERRRIYENFQRGLNGGGMTLGDINNQRTTAPKFAVETPSGNIPTPPSSNQAQTPNANANASNRNFIKPKIFDRNEDDDIDYGSSI